MSAAPRAADDPPREVRHPHLVAGLAAAVLALGGYAATITYGRTVVRDDIAALAPVNFTEKWQGEAVQRELLRHDDLLPMYGSSELIEAMPNQASEFFSSYPTGFAVAPVGDRGAPPRSLILWIASSADVARGRRMVVSLSSSWFVWNRPSADRRSFIAHWSELQTGDFLFRAALPPDLRRRIAQRIFVPDPVQNHLLLHTSLDCVARGCAYQFMLPALEPLWTLRSLPLRAEDYVLALDQAYRTNPARPPSRAQRFDWAALEAQNDSAWRARSFNNPYGIEAGMWTRHEAELLANRGRTSDSAFLAEMEHAPRWDDLELLLETLRAVGARPLVLNTPIKGVFWEFAGVSASARARFYQHFDSVAAPFGFPTRGFAEYDRDPNFLMEFGSHLSQKGWLVYDKTIDAFYHEATR